MGFLGEYFKTRFNEGIERGEERLVFGRRAMTKMKQQKKKKCWLLRDVINEGLGSAHHLARELGKESKLVSCLVAEVQHFECLFLDASFSLRACVDLSIQSDKAAYV